VSDRNIVEPGTRSHVVGIVQPSYWPWLPFFERMAASDTFIYLDDVEFSKNGFFNRNDVKSQSGRTRLTVPITYKGNSKSFISQIETDNRRSWQKKHWRTIEQAYSRAPYWQRYRDEIAQIYEGKQDKLIDIAVPIIEFLKRELDIATPCFLSSEIEVQGGSNEKLRNLCTKFDATHFIVKPGTEHYHPREEFEPFGLRFAYLTYSNIVYPQLHGDFEPNLSALDYLLNCGPGAPVFNKLPDNPL
jgi:hypothetical protein